MFCVQYHPQKLPPNRTFFPYSGNWLCYPTYSGEFLMTNIVYTKNPQMELSLGYMSNLCFATWKDSLLTTLEKLSWSPNTMFSSLPMNQLTAYVFWATAKDSPPSLNKMNVHVNLTYIQDLCRDGTSTIVSVV